MAITEREMEKSRRQERIFRTAARVLCNLGYEKASLRDIAEATHMTKAGLYYYFKSKEDLLYQLLDGYMDELIKGIREIHERVEDPHEFLKEAIRFQVGMYHRDSIRSKLIIHDENCLSGAYYRRLKDKQREYIAYWRNGLERLCLKESIKLDFLSVYVNFLVGICNWIYQWYNARGDVKPDDLAERIYDFFLYGIDGNRVPA
ncbi:TetR/AcrR family transcriptional regulator [Desulfatiglans anilini]|uniref:TetR/AcrR family transcriptional regulator n=1 Tax=Desulfatiglans anilini TaxID=90728 RepID=UPI00040A21B3|nr:TetR/AcrR family transcriptional regulator [Desulfatiglans anilini]